MLLPTGSLSPETLSRIMLMQGMIGNLPDPPAVLSFVARGLQDLPGVCACSHVAAASPDDLPSPAGDDQVVLPLEVADRTYGALVLELDDRGAFAPYELHVRNLCFMVVVVLEERRQRAVNAEYQQELERRVAERTQQLAVEKDRLAVTLRSIGDGVITTDIDGRIVLLNAVAERLTGWTQGEAEGHLLDDCFRTINEQTRAPHSNLVDMVLASDGTIELEDHTVLVARDGAEYAIAHCASPIHTDNGESIGVVLVFRDVTERHRMLEVMQRTDRLDALGVLAGGLAHDFNNLLSGIFGYVGLARMDTKDPVVAKSLGEALGALDRARGLTRQLLTFAKGGAPVRRPTNLPSLIQETVQFALSGSNVACHFDVPQGLWPCNCDSIQIAQVIDNLVINAVQAMPLGGGIDVVASNVSLPDRGQAPLPPGPYVRIAVRDRGVGIPESILNRIFDPFFTTKQKGNGLGLATCHSIVRRHEGCIQVTSQPGEGTTFTVYLPAAPEGSVSDAESSRTLHSGTGTILVMDDESLVLEVMATMLTRVGYSVLTARSGEEALEVHRRETSLGRKFEAAILDLTVPGAMGGKEAGELLRQRDQTLTLYVCSGYAQDPVVADPGRYGFAGSLSKPFTCDELMAMLTRQGVSSGASRP